MTHKSSDLGPLGDDGLPELISDFQNKLTDQLARFAPICEELRQEGLTGIVILGSYDDLTRTPHNQWIEFGNPLTVRGQVADYEDIARMRAGLVVIDDEE